MAWLAVDLNDEEYIFEYEPIRNFEYSRFLSYDMDGYIDLPQGTIEKIIGRKLTWDDEPVEI